MRWTMAALYLAFGKSFKCDEAFYRLFLRGKQRIDDRIQLGRLFRNVPRIIEHRLGPFPSLANGFRGDLECRRDCLGVGRGPRRAAGDQFVAAACSFTADATDSAVAAMSEIVFPVLAISSTERRVCS